MRNAIIHATQWFSILDDCKLPNRARVDKHAPDLDAISGAFKIILPHADENDRSGCRGFRWIPELVHCPAVAEHVARAYFHGFAPVIESKDA